MEASLQSGIRGNLVSWWEEDIDDSCFCAYVLIYWVESGIELSMCAGNDEE